MIRKSSSSLFRSFYREVLPEALLRAWKEKWMWPWALFASFMVSGGLFDVAANIFDRVRESGSLLFTPALVIGLKTLPWHQIALTLTGVFSLFVLTCFAQIVLVAGHGQRVSAKESASKQAFLAGREHLFSVMGLTLLTGIVGWVLRFVLLIPYLISHNIPTAATILVTVFSTIGYLVLAVLLTATHLFALNAIVLQGANIISGLHRAWDTARDSWLHLVELGLALWFVNAVALLGAFILFVITSIPLALLIIASALLNNGGALTLTYTLINILAVLILLLTAAVTISFQYGVWNKLYIRLGEGGLAPKIHRIARWFLKKA